MSILSFFPAGGTIAGAPQFTYTGNFILIDDDGGHYRIKLLSSGTFTLTNATRNMRVFLVGGGAGGGTLNGGGGGYTLNSVVSIVKDTPYPVVIGAGGAAGTNGNASTGFGLTANPGLTNGNGGSGGGGRYRPGASDGGNGQDGGQGQGTTTREFHLTAGQLYGGGGGGTNQGSTANPGPAGGDGGGGAGAGYEPTGDPAYPAIAGAPNSGGGGGAAYDPGVAAAGGNGIVILSDVR
jgi:hypothetical protein